MVGRQEKYRLFKANFISLRLPFGRYIHYAKGRKIGMSRPTYGKGLAHYNPGGKLIGRMNRSFFGEPNHYDKEGKCIGFSRRIHAFKIRHYTAKGKTVGQTHLILGCLFIHKFWGDSTV